MKKKINRFAALTLALTLSLSLAACGGASNNNNQSTAAAPTTEAPASSATEAPSAEPEKAEPVTLGQTLLNTFKEEIKNTDDLNALAEAVSAEKISGYDCAVIPVEEGYLNGFTEEVKGFEEGVMFGPIIGSIPFVGYIFKSEDPATLADTLTNLADPRWNICTEAEETVVEAVDGYVFFTMLPGEE